MQVADGPSYVALVAKERSRTTIASYACGCWAMAQSHLPCANKSTPRIQRFSERSLMMIDRVRREQASFLLVPLCREVARFELTLFGTHA
mmetsp:Transcript_20635/g.63020  ORF Transcript_20635/g.63020 Transcript_20635/m.63020 type:complete len:90 (-) Transcript_20635:118-387(-)